LKYERELLRTALPAFSLGKIIEVGPGVSINFGAELSEIKGGVTVVADGKVKIPDDTGAVVDLVHPFKYTKFTGSRARWEGKTDVEAKNPARALIYVSFAPDCVVQGFGAEQPNPSPRLLQSPAKKKKNCGNTLTRHETSRG